MIQKPTEFDTNTTDFDTKTTEFDTNTTDFDTKTTDFDTNTTDFDTTPTAFYTNTTAFDSNFPTRVDIRSIEQLVDSPTHRQTDFISDVDSSFDEDENSPFEQRSYHSSTATTHTDIPAEPAISTSALDTFASCSSLPTSESNTPIQGSVVDLSFDWPKTEQAVSTTTNATVTTTKMTTGVLHRYVDDNGDVVESYDKRVIPTDANLDLDDDSSSSTDSDTTAAAADDESSSDVTRVYTDTFESEPLTHTDVEYTTEVLPDGSTVRRTVTRVTSRHTTTKRIIVDGADSDDIRSFTDAFIDPGTENTDSMDTSETMPDGSLVTTNIQSSENESLTIERNMHEGTLKGLLYLAQLTPLTNYLLTSFFEI